eukprot:gene17235-20504_t
MDNGVPEYSSAENIYPELYVRRASDRVSKLRQAFEKMYGSEPEIIFRAPGRVNLIGEHIDYEGYGVLPMAIVQDTLLAIRRVSGGSNIRVANVKPEEYPEVLVSNDPEQELQIGKRRWSDYFICGFKVVASAGAVLTVHKIPCSK